MADTNKETEKPARRGFFQSFIFFIALICVLIGASIYAAILSWRCNTNAGLNIIAKIVFATAAAFGNVSYLIWYALYQLNTCTLLKRIPEATAPVVPTPTGGRKMRR